MRVSSQRKILIGFSVGVALVILVTLGTYQNVVAYRTSASSITQENAMKSDLNDLLTAVYNGQAGERQFMANGSTSDIESFISTAPTAYKALGSDLVPDSNLTGEYQTLQNAITEEITLLQVTLATDQSQGLAAAQQHLAQSATLDASYSGSISGAVTRMNARLDVLETQDTALAVQRSGQETDLIFLYSVFALGLMTYAASVIDRHVKRETREIRVSNLLQDVLTHDLRNYNQSLLLNAELLKELSKGDERTSALVEKLTRSVEQSTKLVERGQRLAGVIAEGAAVLGRVDLVESIQRALLETRRAFPDKEIQETLELPRAKRTRSTGTAGSESPRVMVLADERLDEVFVNLFSNSAKFTSGELVRLEIRILPRSPDSFAARLGLARPSWWIAIRDYGSGVWDPERDSHFDRAPQSPHAAGLGLVIVQSLVVGRYGGTVTVGDSGRPRAQGGQKKRAPPKEEEGTTVLLSLRRAKVKPP